MAGQNNTQQTIHLSSEQRLAILIDVMDKLKHLYEHFDEIVKQQIDPIKKPDFSGYFLTACQPMLI